MNISCKFQRINIIYYNIIYFFII